MSESRMLKAALAYARKGKKVFPTKVLGKTPLTSHGFKDATSDPNQIREWWGKSPNANIAMPTGEESGVVVLDVDPRNGGTESFYQLNEKYRRIPDTLSQKTGGQGSHFLFDCPKGTSIRTTTLVGYSGLDIKADGGYILLPPSKTKKRYSWVDSQVKPAPLPAWLLDLIIEGSKARAEPLPEKISVGKRNDTLTSLAGSMRHRGSSPDAILAALQVENKRCEPPLSDDELCKIAASVGRYPPGPDVVTSPGTQHTSSIAAIFSEAGFDDLSEASSADDIERVVRNLSQNLNGADGLRRMSVLEEASKRLSKIRLVQAPKALLKAGLNVQQTGSKSVAEEQKVEPWPEPVDGATLLNEIVDLIENYFVLPPKAASLLALWILGSWLYELFFIFPYLAIHSPLMRCGKSNLLAAVGALAKGSLKADDITQAVLVRCVEQFKPTLLLDELDQAGLRQNPALRAILNAGYRADGKSARAVPAKDGGYEVKFFNVYCPKGLAGIGNFLPSTISDRSIHIFMTRKTKQEQVTRWSMKKVQSECEPIKRQLARWVEDYREILAHTPEPHLLEELDDRQWDNWEPLIMIADLVGGVWPETARDAAKTLSKTAKDDNARVELLTDIKGLFDGLKADRMSSQDLCEALAKLEHRRWPEWRNGKPITARQMASLLQPFGIRPKGIRIGDKTPRGYELNDLRDAFTRYIPSSDPQQVQQASNDAGSRHLDQVQHDHQCCTSKNAENSHKQTIVADVAPKKGVSEEVHKTEDGFEVY